jgi:pyridoxal phosphate enzyme (YggS family)
VIETRAAAVRERIAAAAARADRRPDDITLVAVSKTFPAEAVREAFAAGLRHFGENRVQEAEGKIRELADLRSKGIVWHLVGHLQANKARKAAGLFDRIHSVDSQSLGAKIARAAEAEGKLARVLVQVDLAGEETKFGLDEDALTPTLEGLAGLPGLRVEGLMILPPFEEDSESVRPYFRRLRQLRDDAAAAGLLQGSELSMGMSHDLEAAVEEGATMVRVGTALFGPRSPRPRPGAGAE